MFKFLHFLTFHQLFPHLFSFISFSPLIFFLNQQKMKKKSRKWFKFLHFLTFHQLSPTYFHSYLKKSSNSSILQLFITNFAHILEKPRKNIIQIPSSSNFPRLSQLSRLSKLSKLSKKKKKKKKKRGKIECIMRRRRCTYQLGGHCRQRRSPAAWERDKKADFDIPQNCWAGPARNTCKCRARCAETTRRWCAAAPVPECDRSAPRCAGRPSFRPRFWRRCRAGCRCALSDPSSCCCSTRRALWRHPHTLWHRFLRTKRTWPRRST